MMNELLCEKPKAMLTLSIKLLYWQKTSQKLTYSTGFGNISCVQVCGNSSPRG